MPLPTTQDIWFLLSKKHHLLRMPTIVQRWLDFLSVYGLQVSAELPRLFERSSVAASCIIPLWRLNPQTP